MGWYYGFTIKGTHEGENKNPLPKIKLTKRQQWTKKAIQYAHWKEHVKAAFIDSVPDEERAEMIRNIIHTGHPLTTGKDRKAVMEICIAWGSGVHGDPENIFGSIADALFDQDKYLAGRFDFVDYSVEKPRVVVTIVFS